MSESQQSHSPFPLVGCKTPAFPCPSGKENQRLPLSSGAFFLWSPLTWPCTDVHADGVTRYYSGVATCWG